MSETVTIQAQDGTSARLALRGAEPVSWIVDGRECLWSGDPEHWNRHAPWLFPVVGASVDGQVRVDRRAYPMAQHGFARDAAFALVSQTPESVTMRLSESEESRSHYPFAFALEIEATVRRATLDFAVTVTNPGERPLPYALGFHPAFPWPFAASAPRREVGHSVVFEAPERARVPVVAAGGVLLKDERPIPLKGRSLPLDPSLFEEALVFLDAKSRWMRFTAPDGSAIVMRVEDFPHLAVWTKPTAPFLSLECWTGHADMAGFEGELTERASQRRLAPGQTARHRVGLSLEAADPA